MYAEYGITLTKPNDPIVNVGTKSKPSWIPPELCTVEPGQQYRRKLDEFQTKNMLEFAVRKPAENARRIVDKGAPMMKLSETNQNLVRTKNFAMGKWLMAPSSHLASK